MSWWRPVVASGQGIVDYNGIAASGNRAYPFWTDSRVSSDSDVLTDVLQPGGK